MEPQAPPKRMTRARAAAEASVDTTASAARAAATRAKASTAASKARSSVRSTATATTASVAAKRKIRSDEVETDNEQDELGLLRAQPHIMKAARGVRGRTKKTATDADAHDTTAATEAAAPTTRPHRGRPPKNTVTSEPSTARTTRTKKTAKGDVDGAEEAVGSAMSTTAATAAKKTTRTRTKSTTTSTGPTISVRTAAATVSKSTAPKKRVTFEEPEKENIAPKMTVKTARSTAASKASEPSTGLRAQPTRRAASSTAPKPATAARSARTVASARGKSAAAGSGETKVEKPKPPTPLSPKKVTQVRMARDDVESEDELGATDSQPVYVKPLLRSPSRPGLGLGAQERAKTLTGAGLDLESASRDIGSGLPSDGVLAVSAELTGTILASPARRPPPSPAKDGLLRSPARRLDGVVPLDTAASTVNPTLSRGPLLLSPAKRFPIPAKSSGGSLEDATRSPSKMSLLQTPAKRPASPVKAAIFLQRPNMKPLAVSDIAEELATSPELESALLAPHSSTPAPDDEDDADDADDTDDTDDDDVEDADSLTQMLSEMASNAAALRSDSPTRLRSRDVHAAVAGQRSPGLTDNNTAEYEVPMPAEEDPMEVDGPAVGTAPAITAAVPAGGAFGLRARDLTSFGAESDSEDEPTPRIPFFSAPPDAAPATPCPAGKTGKRRMSRTRSPSSRRGRESLDGRSSAKRLRVSKLGFTPLAEQLNSWKAHSPAKTDVAAEPSIFFEEAMAGQAVSSPTVQGQDSVEEQAATVDSTILSAAAEVLPPIFDNVSLTQEDLELADEANDMSLMETEEMADVVHLTPSAADESESEDSQEYGDENAIPIDPALMEQNAAAVSAAVPPVTPQRVMMHTFHTVSKVPLKAADESSPQSTMRRRSFSAPRRRPAASKTASESSNDGSSTCGLTRNGTVISYSPTKKDRRRDSRRQSRRDSFAGEAAVAEMVSDEEREIVRSLTNSPAPATPAKSDGGWSVAATPARTPRRDIDPALLRGAVVFVDVYTTEGADASGIFVELLTQMGARCVKHWPWNPESDSSSSSAADSTSRIGITHVVYKDGGKRTLEKVRESAGVVQCVGVSWVLDCERENQWLDEAPYYIDTSAMPRGGWRRKSMEPRALANMNGMIVTTPAKQTNVASSYRDCRTAPSTPANEAVDEYEDGEGEVEGPSEWMLTAVPKTPAPEAIARYAAALSPSTPLSDEEEDEDTIMSLHDEQSTLLTRTCPPKNTCYRELGAGILSREKDEGVLMRLMSARRKSLQFAPKIASPLSKAWY
ncbi:hypothetical protein CMQ_1609 [Grosmannia clavigera kw1407]|uniref:BRCT domain-containing protein n=1 Tax=Grosmannia clavigera (strain kw1407 / UAMH 11150) TaxID=655863 RepID=F0XDH1_GROCL|nr:uncharacterized protein CMQ_1609 [Grosmannia clavigera kw1407]EFX04681.1 hypothetical protein CMQ_1609 [Grosmannia clavigera kw1407]